MVQQGKVLTTKPEELSLSPGTEGKERTDSSKLSSDLHSQHNVSVCSNMQTQTHT